MGGTTSNSHSDGRTWAKCYYCACFVNNFFFFYVLCFVVVVIFQEMLLLFLLRYIYLLLLLLFNFFSLSIIFCSWFEIGLPTVSSETSGGKRSLKSLEGFQVKEYPGKSSSYRKPLEGLLTIEILKRTFRVSFSYRGGLLDT